MPQVTKAEIRPGEQGGEMTQALYAHMNNKKKFKKKEIRPVQATDLQQTTRSSGRSLEHSTSQPSPGPSPVYTLISHFQPPEL
jgi:hypothetical protein